MLEKSLGPEQSDHVVTFASLVEHLGASTVRELLIVAEVEQREGNDGVLFANVPTGEEPSLLVAVRQDVVDFKVNANAGTLPISVVADLVAPPEKSAA